MITEPLHSEVIGLRHRNAQLEKSVEKMVQTIAMLNAELLQLRNANQRTSSPAQKLVEEQIRQQQTRLSLFVEQSPLAIVEWNNDFEMVGWNRAAETIFGYSRAEAIGRSYRLIVPSDAHNQVGDVVNQALGDRTEVVNINQNRRKDGTLITCEWHNFPLLDDEGNPMGVVALAQDISDRIQAEQQLRDSQAFLHSVVNGMPDPMFVKDEQHRWVLLNDAMCEFMGYSKSELIGKSDYDIFPKEQADVFWNHDDFVFQTGEEDINEEEFTDADGNLRTISTKKTLFQDLAGNKLLVGMIRDMTDRVQMEAALRESEALHRQLYEQSQAATVLAQEKAAELEQTLHELQRTQLQLLQSEKMSSLGQLVAGVAHEINNPVNFIYANLPYLQNYATDLLTALDLYQCQQPPSPELQAAIAKLDLEFLKTDMQKILESMQVGANRIRDIVLSLRTFSRLDEAEKKRVDLHENLDNTLMLLEHRLKPHAGQPRIRIIKYYDDLPLVECYAGQLNQVFMNILTNALDAMEESLVAGQSSLGVDGHEQKVPTIVIRTELVFRGNDQQGIDDKGARSNDPGRLASHYIRVRIADNGPGMPESVRQHLFDPFFTTKPVGKGTGLGMSISYQIVVDRHGGNLRCESSLGHGAEFWVEIPYL